MTSRKATIGLTAGLSVAALASMLIPACAGYSTCSDRGNCPGEPWGFGGGGTAGSASGGGDNGGSSGDGATSGSGGASAGRGGTSQGGVAGSAGAAGAAPCDGDCKGLTPVCEATSNTCVQCLKGTDCKTPTPACDVATSTCVQCTKSDDCKDSAKPACDTASNSCVACVGNPDCKDVAKPFCDTTAELCVACLKQADCTAATASACNAGQCQPCVKDAECSNISGKGVCNAGTCVQCTVAKEVVCAGKSCNPTTSQCTATAVGTAQFCQPCVADSECIGGNKADPDARCVPMKFMGTARPGGFCLRRVAKTCNPPFEIATSTGSLSGAPSETYCGIDQSSTRCEAVLDLVGSKACSDGLDASCGCTRNKAGTCTDSGQGGVCKTVGVNANRCTIPCASADQCLTTLTCPAVSNSYCQ